MIHDLIYYTAVSIKQSVIVWIVIEGFFYIFQKKFRIKKCLFDFIFIMWFFTMLHIVGMVIVPLVSCVEILQYFGGRLFDIDDVIANSLGAVLGYWLYQIYILKSIQTNGDQYNEDEFNMKNNIL